MNEKTKSFASKARMATERLQLSMLKAKNYFEPPFQFVLRTNSLMFFNYWRTWFTWNTEESRWNKVNSRSRLNYFFLRTAATRGGYRGGALRFTPSQPSAASISPPPPLTSSLLLMRREGGGVAQN